MHLLLIRIILIWVRVITALDQMNHLILRVDDQLRSIHQRLFLALTVGVWMMPEYGKTLPIKLVVLIHQYRRENTSVL